MIQDSFFIRGRSLPAALVLAASLLFASCSREISGAGPSEEGARLYELKGVVVSVDRKKREAVIDHEEIPGFMAAMRMTFPMKDAEVLGAMEGGDLVSATLVVTDDGYRLENVSLVKGGASPPAAGGGAEPALGSRVPDVSLVNQDGRPLRLPDAGGAARVVTFIYTRCPFPDQCPLMSANLAAVNGAVAGDASLRDRVRFLSVTLDPEFDRPGVLKAYGARHVGAEGFARWDFATGEPGEIRRLAEFLGLSYKEESGQIIHSLRTAAIAPDGTLYKLYRGNEWKPAEVVKDLKTLFGPEH